MKLTIAFIFTLASVAISAPSELDTATSLAQNAAQACGAAGSCKGFGGGDLCNDRCKKCTGTSGHYSRGACCGV
jgi:hypothetical protein